MRIRNACGKLARNDSDNADLMREHYHGIFNPTEAPVNIDDATDKLHRRSMRNHLSTTPTTDEIIKVILSLPHNKMPGESQITAEALKALSPEALATIANAVIAY
jgi:hypothetical protein